MISLKNLSKNTNELYFNLGVGVTYNDYFKEPDKIKSIAIASVNKLHMAIKLKREESESFSY